MHFDQLIGAAYDAVLEPERWPAVMAEASRIMDSNLCALRVMDERGEDVMMLAYGDCLTPTLYDEYRRDWIDKDIHFRKVFTAPHLWNRPIFSEREAASEEEERHSPFVHEFLRPMEIGRIAASIWKGDRGAGSVAFHRPLDAPLLSDEVLRRGAMLTGHFMQATRMTAARQSAHTLSQSVAAVFANAAHAVFLLDDLGRIVWLNATAESLLKERRVLVGADARVRLAGEASRIVDGLVHEAASRKDSGGAPHISIIEGEQRIFVRGRVIGRATAPSMIFSRAAILLECAGLPELSAAAPRLQSLFGLTRTEASVAVALTDDQTASEIAAGRGVSEETVRSQMKSIFRKVGVSRRAGLIHIISKLSD